MRPKKIKTLEDLARDMVGDGKSPNLYFVTDQGVVVGASRDFSTAHSYFEVLAARSPRVECALEDRKVGCLASVEPENDISTKLVLRDDSRWLRRVLHS